VSVEPNLEHLELERPLAFVDVEATGVDPYRDRAVELAIVKVAPPGDASRYRHFGREGRPVTFRHLINPGRPIPAEATRVHGLGDADVAGMPSFRAIAHQAARFLEGCDLGGYGIRRFDLPLLAAEFARAGVAFALEGRSIVDGPSIFCARERRDLASAVRFYCGRPHEDAHEARADALASAAVLDGQLGRYRDLHRER
jgi:DNA polymerase-3 subunit epsilon